MTGSNGRWCSEVIRSAKGEYACMPLVKRRCGISLWPGSHATSIEVKKLEDIRKRDTAALPTTLLRSHLVIDI